MQGAYNNKAVVREGLYPKIKRGKRTIEALPGEELMLSNAEVKLHCHQVNLIKSTPKAKNEGGSTAG